MWGHGGLYSDWANYLEQWGADSRPLPARPPALDERDFDPDTWTRLIMRVQEALNERLERWSKALVRHLAEAVDEFSWGRALAQSREGLRAVLEMCNSPGLPPGVVEALTNQVHGVIRTNQETLEADAARDLSGRTSRDAEMRLRQLRRNPLTAVLTEFSPPGAVAEAPVSTTWGQPVPAEPTGGGPPGSRRRIIIDRVDNL